MTLLTKKEILASDDLEIEDVPVPEWGGTVRIRGLTGAERDLFEASSVSLRGKHAQEDLTYDDLDLRNARARLVALAAIGEDGKRLFTKADVKALGEKSGAALDRVYDVAARLSGLTAKINKALAKN